MNLGCEGNSNRFGSKQLCEISCYLNITKSCLEPLNEGTGTDCQTKYYYNPLKADCVQFDYKGYEGNNTYTTVVSTYFNQLLIVFIKGNSNRFDTYDTCQQKCMKTVNIKSGTFDNQYCVANNRIYKYSQRYMKDNCNLCVCYYGTELCSSICQ